MDFGCHLSSNESSSSRGPGKYGNRNNYASFEMYSSSVYEDDFLYLSDNAPQFHLIKSLIEQTAADKFVWKFLPSGMLWAAGVYE